jgi:hypothetical protein
MEGSVGPELATGNRIGPKGQVKGASDHAKTGKDPSLYIHPKKKSHVLPVMYLHNLGGYGETIN